MNVEITNIPNATNPNLDGKPVFVIAVKGDKATNPTLTYSFINLEKLVDIYLPLNAGISIAGYSIGINLSQDAGNILSIANDGLLGEMKVAGASVGKLKLIFLRTAGGIRFLPVCLFKEAFIMSNNLTREEHLAALATAARNFALDTQNETLGLVVEALQVAGGSSAVSTAKTTPTLSIGSWTKNGTTYTATISYDGDGELSTNLGSISGTTLTVTDANSFKADLFVSIHCNAATGKAQGTETYCCRGATSGRKLAETIHKQITGSLPLVDRGVKEAGFFVLANTNMPAVLVETAFIDNPADAKLLIECEDDFARAIARDVNDYLSRSTKSLPDVVDTPKSALIRVNCGYRCTKHNAEVGGVPNSQHVLGTAADITILQIDFDRAAKLVQSLPFDGTGFYPPLENDGAWFIHVDVRDGGQGSHIEWWE